MLSFPIDFLQSGLEIRYDGRPYLVRYTTLSLVYVAPVFPSKETENDRHFLDREDPLITLHWDLWPVWARAAHFLAEVTGHPAAYRYLDGAHTHKDGRPLVSTRASIKLLHDALYRQANGMLRSLGALSPWTDNGREPSKQIFTRTIYIGMLDSYAIVSEVAGESNPRQGGWTANWWPSPKEPLRNFQGSARGLAGMAEADEVMGNEWVLL